MELTIGAEIGDKEGGDTNRGEEGKPGMEDRRNFRTLTGQRGEAGNLYHLVF